MKKHPILLSPFLLLLASLAANAQYTGTYYGALSTTWNNPVSSFASVMIQGQINRKMLEQSIANQQGRRARSTGSGSSSTSAPTGSQTVPATAVYTALRFKPAANSGVAKTIANAIGRDPKERAQLLGILQEVKKSYEAEAAKAGTSNNIAAALTFFLAAGSMAYHQTDAPAETVTDALIEVLQQELHAKPEFKSMTNLQKQQMHDWLVVIGGFVLAGYLEAVETKDAKQLADYKELANECFKIVFGTGAEKFNLAEIK